MNDGLPEKYRDGVRSTFMDFPKITRAVLFGSRAMGKYRNASDIDLTLEGAGITLDDLLAIKAQIRQLDLPVEVDLVIREKIDNPALEQHIAQFGREWYRREPL